MPKEWRVKRIYDLNKDDFGPQSAYMYLTSFTVRSSKFINQNDLEALHFWSSNCSNMTETQTSAEKPVQHTPSVCWTWLKLDIWECHNQQDCCTKCYNKATMDCLSMIRDHDFVVKCSIQNIHYKSSQLLKTINYQTLLSINLYSVIIQRHLLGSYR